MRLLSLVLVSAFFDTGELGSETCARCVAQNKVWCDGFCEDVCYDDAVISTVEECPRIDRNASPIGPGQLVKSDYGLGVVHRYYVHLEEFTILNASLVEIKSTVDGQTTPIYFKHHQVDVVRDVRHGDIVMSHFKLKSTKERSRGQEEARVINTTVDTVAVNFTADKVVSTVPWDFITERIIE